jgi:L-iditol 2-dehydrogenase
MPRRARRSSCASFRVPICRRRRAAATQRSEVCGTDVHLWHGRSRGVPYPIIPGHVSAGVDRRGARSAHRHRRLADSRRRSRRVLRRASHVRPLPRVHRAPHADALRRAPRVRHHRFGRRGLFGGWAQAIYLEPGVGLARCPTRSRSTTTSAAAAAADRRAHRRARRDPLGDAVVVQGPAPSA